MASRAVKQARKTAKKARRNGNWYKKDINMPTLPSGGSRAQARGGLKAKTGGG